MTSKPDAEAEVSKLDKLAEAMYDAYPVAISLLDPEGEERVLSWQELQAHVAPAVAFRESIGQPIAGEDEEIRIRAQGAIAHLWAASDDPHVMNELMDAVTSIPLGASDARIAYATRDTLLTALIGPRPEVSSHE